MKKIKKALRRSLFFGILAAVLFVAGIPMIVIGASRAGESALWWIMAAPGIAFVVFGFYGSAFIWIFYGSLRGRYRIVCAVENERLYSVQEIAQQLGMREKEVRSRLTVCFSKGYLAGYKREGDRILPNATVAFSERTLEGVCPNCGGKVVYKLTDARPVCPYCGSVYKKEE